MKCPTCRVRMVPHTDLTATTWICPRCEHEQRQEKEPRDPSVIAGAMAGVIDSNLRADLNSSSPTDGFGRLRELLDELEHALLLQQLAASVNRIPEFRSNDRDED